MSVGFTPSGAVFTFVSRLNPALEERRSTRLELDVIGGYRFRTGAATGFTGLLFEGRLTLDSSTGASSWCGERNRVSKLCSPITCNRRKFVDPDLVRVPATMAAISRGRTYPPCKSRFSANSTSASVEFAFGQRIGMVP